MFSRNGDGIAMTDSHGFLSIFGYGSGEQFRKVSIIKLPKSENRKVEKEKNKLAGLKFRSKCVIHVQFSVKPIKHYIGEPFTRFCISKCFINNSMKFDKDKKI